MDGIRQRHRGRIIRRRVEPVTFIAGILCHEGIVLVADRRRSKDLDGGYIDNATKIRKLDDNMAVLICGDYGAFLTLFDRHLCNKLSFNDPYAKLDSIAAILAKQGPVWLEAGYHKEDLMEIFNTSLLLAGYYGTKQILKSMSAPYFKVISHEEDGFAILGSKRDFGEDVILDGYNREMKMDDAVALGLRALRKVMSKTVFVGGTPQVVEITPDGYEEIEDTRIRNLWKKSL